MVTLNSLGIKNRNIMTGILLMFLMLIGILLSSWNSYRIIQRPCPLDRVESARKLTKIDTITFNILKRLNGEKWYYNRFYGATMFFYYDTSRKTYLIFKAVSWCKPIKKMEEFYNIFNNDSNAQIVLKKWYDSDSIKRQISPSNKFTFCSALNIKNRVIYSKKY